jgi:hypothetical protein
VVTFGLEYLSSFGDYQLLIYGAVMIVFILALPNGLSGALSAGSQRLRIGRRASAGGGERLSEPSA